MNDTDNKQNISINGSQKEFNIAGGNITVNERDKKKNDSENTEQKKYPVKRILILAANPKHTPPLRLSEEVRDITKSLQAAKHRAQFEIKAELAVQLRDINKVLLDYKPNIVHFTGHGQEEGLVFEDEMSSPSLMSASSLGRFFKLFSDQVECVVMNACYSARQATAISKHIDYVVGMSKEIKDEAAIEFAVAFYNAIWADRAIEDAFEFGKVAIQNALPDSKDQYLIPILKKKNG